jgi:hypothetical protein
VVLVGDVVGVVIVTIEVVLVCVWIMGLVMMRFVLVTVLV